MSTELLQARPLPASICPVMSGLCKSLKRRDVISIVWARADRAQTRADEAIIGLLRQAERDREARVRNTSPSAAAPAEAPTPQLPSRDACAGRPAIMRAAEQPKQSTEVR